MTPSNIGTRTPIGPGSARWLDTPTGSSDLCTWAACDESGRDGDNLHGDAEVFCLGSVRLADDRASAILSRLAVHQPGRTDLKWTQITPRVKQAVIADLVEHTRDAGGELSIVLMHNPFSAVAKTVDLLIEEHFHALGVDLYENRTALKMAYFLFREAPGQLGSKWTGLLDAFISLHRRRHPNKQAAAGIPKATVDDFYDALDNARASQPAGTLHDLLTIMAKTRDHAEHL